MWQHFFKILLKPLQFDNPGANHVYHIGIILFVATMKLPKRDGIEIKMEDIQRAAAFNVYAAILVPLGERQKFADRKSVV